MESRITATEAERTFSEILDRVRYRGEAFIVERAGEPVCRITPVGPSAGFTGEDLADLLDVVPPPDPAYLDVVEAAVNNQPRVPPCER